ncbi:hypothetical protein K431DRAFT_271272 [Polychaeton citri CBS 116435]|uniref:Zn(2)-C6 fungal-type domain-containing protein n=1 Tax=Polychaeton citri CBS 116435 TaxID=1314669 RepID=A0A9P4UN16_9PEZI|nr:hypothetical protein K431DRAFT_271272 [Polychaeton citri CBS 116435]
MDSSSGSPRREANVSRRQRHRVRKRAPNACNRCRQQKIRCTGAQPCEQCNKRNLICCFDDQQRKVLVSKGFLDNLEKLANCRSSSVGPVPEGTPPEQAHLQSIESRVQVERGLTVQDLPTPVAAPSANSEEDSQSNTGQDALSLLETRLLTNPLVSGGPVYTADLRGRPSYLGTSSNWSFGRRILTMVHEKVFGGPLPPTSLLFEGSAYDLGWDGCRTSISIDDVLLPTTDFALFLINAVKFHCGQLFHVFDEKVFMQGFGTFQQQGGKCQDPSNLWFVHYLLVLALGKAFIVRVGKQRQPPGADLFVQAMKILPDITFTTSSDPLQTIEVLCCAAIYLQCLDMRKAAYNIIGQAKRAAVVEGIHANVQDGHHPPSFIERCREIWWTVYVLDCHMSSLMGVPLSISEQDITAQLPSFDGSIQKSLALGFHVKLAKITAQILHTVYGKEGRMDDHFLKSMKVALKNLADINDERMVAFPVDVKHSSSSLSRLSAYLHLFHHQCIMLTTRPLLFSFWQKRLQSLTQFRVRSSGGARNLLRMCIASAHQSVELLAALQAHNLLESFIPFDLESTWSSAVILLITNAVDPSLYKHDGTLLDSIHSVFDEMIAKGNLLASFRKAELRQLDLSLKRLAAMAVDPGNATSEGFDSGYSGWDTLTHMGTQISQGDTEPLQGWNCEGALSSEQLVAVADSLDFSCLDWLQAVSPETY